MSHSVRETLDETIDRVAAAMTAMPADPGFGERLAPRFASSAPWAARSLLFAAAAAAMVLLAVTMTNRREPAAVHIAAAPATGSPPAPTADALEPRDILADAAPVSPAPTGAAEGVEPHAHADAAPGIAALTPPDSLHVENLAVHQLTIEAVEVERLEVPTLEIAALGVVDEEKE